MVSAYDPASGDHKWTAQYPLATSQPPGGPGASGGQPDDNGLQRCEACITDAAIAVRDASTLQVLSAGDGHPLWALPSPSPISQITVVGNELLVAADHLAAYDLLTGGITWQNLLRNAHLAISTIPPCIVAVDEQVALGLDTNGRTLWQRKMPVPAGNAAVDAVRLNPHVAYVTFDASGDGTPQTPATGPKFDVLAIALDSAG